MNAKFLILLTAVAATFGWHVGAQPNATPVNRTNLIAVPEGFREVNGQLYNAESNALWTNFQGECLKVLANGVAISTFTMEPIYQATTVTERMHPDRDYLHASDAKNDEHLVAKTIQVGEKKVPGRKIVLRNYPAELYPAVGSILSFRAMRVGTSDYNGDTLELWDYGTKPTQDELRKLKVEADERQKAAEKELDEQRRVIAENAAAAKRAIQAKVVKWNQEQADKGDPTGLLRMGEFYRDGDSVPKDLDKAREYFTKASAAGSPDAADELSKLNQVSTNAPANP